MILLCNILWWLSLTDFCPSKRLIWEDGVIDGQDPSHRKTTKDVGRGTCIDPSLTIKIRQHVLRDVVHVGVGVHENEIIL